jgi:hypothetical protein
LCLIVAHLEWPDMGTSTASEFAVSLAAKGEYSTYAGGYGSRISHPQMRTATKYAVFLKKTA